MLSCEGEACLRWKCYCGSVVVFFFFFSVPMLKLLCSTPYKFPEIFVQQCDIKQVQIRKKDESGKRCTNGGQRDSTLYMPERRTEGNYASETPPSL